MSAGRLHVTADRRFRTVARYLVVGLVSYGVDIGILLLCWHVFHLPVWLSTTLGFWGSFSVNFLLSRHWTFGVSHLAPGGQLIRYGLLVAANYVVTVLAVTVLYRSGVDLVVARTLTLAVLTLWTFVIYRSWVFKKGGVVG